MHIFSQIGCKPQSEMIIYIRGWSLRTVCWNCPCWESTEQTYRNKVLHQMISRLPGFLPFGSGWVLSEQLQSLLALRRNAAYYSQMEPTSLRIYKPTNISTVYRTFIQSCMWSKISEGFISYILTHRRRTYSTERVIGCSPNIDLSVVIKHLILSL